MGRFQPEANRDNMLVDNVALGRFGPCSSTEACRGGSDQGHQRLRENRRKKEKGERTGDKRGEEFSGGGWTGGRKCLTIPRFNG